MVIKIKLFERLNKLLVLIFPLSIVIPIGFSFNSIYLSWTEFILFLLVFNNIFIYLIRNKINDLFIIKKELFPVGIFFSLIFLSLLFAKEPMAGMMILVRLLESLVVMVVVMRIIEDQNILIENIFTAIKIAGLAGALYAIAQFYFGIGLISGNQNITRVFGFLHGGVFGIFPALGFVLSIIAIITKRTLIYKTINILFSIICFLGLFLTLTRTWLLAAFVGVAVFLGSKSIKNLFISFLVFTFLLLVSLKIFINSEIIFSLYGKGGEIVSNRYNEIFYGESSSINARLQKWESVFNIALKNPVLGVGLENLDLNVKYASDLGQKRSDNQWFDILAIGGIFSFILFAYMMIWMLITGFKLCNRPEPIGSNGRQFIAIYSTWFIGSMFWAILYGFSGLMFTYIVTIGIYLNYNDKTYSTFKNQDS